MVCCALCSVEDASVFYFALGSYGCTDRIEGNDLVDCISTAHPSLLEKSEIDAVGKPFQLIIPETDPQFTKELADHYFQVLPSLKLDSDYRYFPGLVHGFATRGDTSDPAQKLGLERAKDAAVSWFKQYLH